MTPYPSSVQRVIDHGYDFKFGDYLSMGWELMTKNAGVMILFALCYGILKGIATFITGIGTLGMSILVEPCLMAGVMLLLERSMHGGRGRFEDIFKGFDYLGQLALSVLMQIGIVIILFVPLIIVAFYTGFNGWFGGELTTGDVTVTAIAGALTGLAILYVSVAWSLSTYLIVFHKMDAWPALEASRKIVNRQWFAFFAFYLVAGIIYLGGAILLIIGLLFTYPLYLAMCFAAARDVVPPVEATAEERLTDHLLDADSWT